MWTHLGARGYQAASFSSHWHPRHGYDGGEGSKITVNFTITGAIY